MKKLKQKTKKRLKVLSYTFFAILIVSIVSFLIYTSYFYEAEDIAVELLKDSSEINVIDNLTIVKASDPSDTAIVFYPGAKVEAIAYLPMLEKLKENGITSIIVEMPFNMAIFDSNAADDVFELLPDIKNWYISGHSMGGAMASSYASKNSEKIKGLILLGAYVYGDYPPEKSLTIYGTLNSNLEKNIDYTENIVVIEGGNHAQFGNYGAQKGDPPATMSSEEQQDIAVEAILKFIEENNSYEK